MQVFRTALKVFFRHPLYLAIYIGWLGCMGLFVGLSFAPSTPGGYIEERPTVAIVDRDGSAFSQGIADFLGEHAELVTVEDDERALQDATAQDQAAYIVIIPDGFGSGFIDAAADPSDANDMPKLQTVVSYESYAGPMMDNLVDEYLDTAAIYVSTGVSDDEGKVAQLAGDDLAQSADISVLESAETSSISSRYQGYMMFSVYPAMLAIIVCIAVVMKAFNGEEVRRRDFASSASSLSMNLQIALACCVIVLLVWVWIGGLGLVAFGGSLAEVGTQAITSGLLTLFMFCLVALALGFLIGQLTESEVVMNASANILGLVLSFLGGTWVSLDLVGEPMITIARFTPTYYYGDALSWAYGTGGITGSTTSFAADLGIMALFALAIFAVALAIGRRKRGSAGKVHGAERPARDTITA